MINFKRPSLSRALCAGVALATVAALSVPASA